MKRWTSLVVAVLLALALVAATSRPAAAAPAGWAELTFGGDSNAYGGTMTQQPTGFPQASYVSDSTSGSSVGRQGGTSTYLNAGTPVGARYGTSRDRPYLNLRPYTSNGSGQPASSTTTYTFERPTPASGWTFVLGDIDADEVQISATGEDRQPVEPSELGFRSVFNYAGGTDLPTWIGAEARLRGNTAATDTDGASAWFEPTVGLRSLTFVFTRRAGFPVYQTWFSALSYTLSGTVETPAGLDPAGLELRLYGPDGNVVATTLTDDDGDYRFADLASYDGYRVQLVRPTGYTSDDPLNQTVDLGAGDRDDVDFSLRAIVPVPVSGSVTAGQTPVAGAVVTLRDADGNSLGTATSDAAGDYVFENVAAGSGYTLTVSPPGGYTVDGPAELTFDVPVDSEAPIVDQDFALLAPATGSASGTVRDQENGTDPPVPGVLVTINGPGGAQYQVRTDGFGRWSLDQLPPGDYTVEITAPDGADVIGPGSLDFTIDQDGTDETGLDFLIDRALPPPSYTAGGTVTDENDDPVPGVVVEVVDGDGNGYGSTTTDANGDWSLEGLLDGDWTARVEVPSGYEDADPRDFEVDGADVGDVDFALTRQAGPSPSATPTSSPSATPSAVPSATSTAPTDDSTDDSADGSTGSRSGSDLADTGLPPGVTLAGLGGLALIGAGTALVRVRATRRQG